MVKILILLLIIFYINSQFWHSELNGYDIYEHNNGYSGIYGLPFTDFYLCSERKYRVHYSSDDPLTWSQEFTACQPAGIGRFIDAITVSGGLKYRGRAIDTHWLGEMTGYNISDLFYGYSGTLKTPICSFLVEGGDYYRSGHNFTYGSSDEHSVAKKVIQNLFLEDKSPYNYDVETLIFQDSTSNIKLLLLNTSKINFDGDILIQVENDIIIDSNYNRLISDKLKSHLNKVIDFDYDKIRNFIEEKFSTGLRNGTISITFNWSQKLVEIDIASKIQAIHYSYRGGFRINIRLNDVNLLLPKIQKILIVLYKYKGGKIPEELISEFNSFEKIEDIINDLDTDAIIAEEIILFQILSSILPYN